MGLRENRYGPTRILTDYPYLLADPQQERQAYLLNTTVWKLFAHLKKCRKLSLKLSIVYQIFNCIRNNTGTLGDRAFMIGVPVIALGVPALTLDIPAINADVLPGTRAT